MKKRLIGLLGLGAVAIAAVFATSGAAAASAAGAPRAVTLPFAAQAAAAGLTGAQAVNLQNQVNQILAQDGGTQMAANEIALPHGASVLLVLPGQTYARVLPGAVNLGFAPVPSKTNTSVNTIWTAPTVTVTGGSFTPTGGPVGGNGASCNYHYLCVWQGLNGTGTQFNVSECNVNQELPGSGWNTYGSWINNQTAGVSAYFLDQNQHVYYTTPGSGYWESGYNWGPIWYLDACS